MMPWPRACWWLSWSWSRFLVSGAYQCAALSPRRRTGQPLMKPSWSRRRGEVETRRRCLARRQSMPGNPLTPTLTRVPVRSALLCVIRLGHCTSGRARLGLGRLDRGKRHWHDLEQPPRPPEYVARVESPHLWTLFLIQQPCQPPDAPFPGNAMPSARAWSRNESTARFSERTSHRRLGRRHPAPNLRSWPLPMPRPRPQQDDACIR